MKLGTTMLAALFGVAVAGIAHAGSGFSVKPFVFDPDGTGIVVSAWVTHQGLSDAGKSDHALFLQKDGLTSVNAAAGAEVTGVNGITLEEIGFDIRTDGHCGAGAPRFNVQASDGFHFLGGCANGTITPLSADWDRVRIDPSSPTHAFPPIAAGAKIVSISIIFDEGTDTGPDFTGLAYIDNIDINGTLIGKPGNTK